MAEAGFWQVLSDTLHRAVNLRVVTLVGDAEVSGALDALRVSAPATSTGALVTDVNLVGGDVTHIVSEKLLGAEHAELRSAHQAAVTQAHEIVARNINILVAVAKEIGGQLGALPPPSSPGPDRGAGG